MAKLNKNKKVVKKNKIKRKTIKKVSKKKVVHKKIIKGGNALKDIALITGLAASLGVPSYVLYKYMTVNKIDVADTLNKVAKDTSKMVVSIDRDIEKQLVNK